MDTVMTLMVLILFVAVLMLSTIFETSLSTSTNSGIREKFGRANAYYAQGKYQEAHDLYKEIIKVSPENVDCKCNLGSLLVDIGRTEEGEALYRQALEQRENHPVALFNLAMMLQDSKEQSRIDESRVLYKKLINVEPGNAEGTVVVDILVFLTIASIYPFVAFSFFSLHLLYLTCIRFDTRLAPTHIVLLIVFHDAAISVYYLLSTSTSCNTRRRSCPSTCMHLFRTFFLVVFSARNRQYMMKMNE
jgi:tetratricopeptide (TPR) repeat protein